MSFELENMLCNIKKRTVLGTIHTIKEAIHQRQKNVKSGKEYAYKLFIYSFIYLFLFNLSILLTHSKATEALIQRASNYPDLLPEMPRFCCPLEI